MGIICKGDEIGRLRGEIERQKQRIETQNKKIESQNNEIENHKKKLESETKEKENFEKALGIAIKEDPKLISELKNCKSEIDLSKYETNIIHIIKERQKEVDAIKFYDVIVSIQSIKDIIKGWNIRTSQNFDNNYKNFINQKLLKIGVIGNSNKGKSFILSKLSKFELPSGTSIKTEGLSVKYPDKRMFNNKKIALLDSAGLETPVIKNNNDFTKIKNGAKEDNIKDNKIKNGIDKVENNNAENQESSKNELFKEKSKEKILTELFLQNYIIHNSDILIVVLGILTYSEQKILNRIKTELKRAKLSKTLYIIHNLNTYITTNQVESYINETLLKSATFELKKRNVH